MSVERDFTNDFIKWRWRACVGATVVGTAVFSRDSTSLDKDLTKLRKGLEDDSVVDLQGEEEVLELVEGGLAKGRSEGQEELALGAEDRWEWEEVGIIVMAGEGVCECGSEGCTDKVVDETGSTAAPDVTSSAVDSNSSSSFASKPVATQCSSPPEASSCSDLGSGSTGGP